MVESGVIESVYWQPWLFFYRDRGHYIHLVTRIPRRSSLSTVVTKDRKYLSTIWPGLFRVYVMTPTVPFAGMLPILKAPVDDNDTLTTLINRFMAISDQMGQKPTIIIVDQPLYSRGKELVWANPMFEGVIFLMGGFHICFNFLKRFGQHMDRVGLDDIKTDAGVYVANTTHTMLDSKRYYRACIRSSLVHQVTNVKIKAG